MTFFLMRLVFGTVILFVSFHANAQTSSHDLLSAYDARLGAENLALHNGRAHVNPYRIRNDNHNYYKTPEFLAGSVIYEGQPYYGLLLKYDINQDLLVLKTAGEYSYLGVELIKTYVDGFSIDGKKFVNLDKAIGRPESVSGYYEESFSGKQLTLYTKHYKNGKKRDGAQITFDDFKESPSFVFKSGTAYHKADSKKEIIELFPAQKRRINEFYQKDRKLEKSDQKLFMANLARFIDSFANTATP